MSIVKPFFWQGNIAKLKGGDCQTNSSHTFLRRLLQIHNVQEMHKDVLKHLCLGKEKIYVT